MEPVALPYREIARQWLDIACAVDGDHPDGGVRVTDPVYQEVTEYTRDQGPRYSSCADLAHWLLFRLGVRSGWINRAEHRGWRPIVNVTRLCASPFGLNPSAHVPLPGERFARGDVLVIWRRADTTDAHVLVVDVHADDAIVSWDYGQGPLAAVAWRDHDHVEGRKRTRRARLDQGVWELDGRRVRSCLSLATALADARAAGELTSPDLPPGHEGAP